MLTTIPLSSHEVNTCLAALPLPVRDVLIAYSGKVCVAGGFIRAILNGEKVNDIDLFVGSEELANRIAETLRIAGTTPYRTEKAITLRGYPIVPQVVYKWAFSHPSRVIELFDFTIAQAVIWFENDQWKSACHVDYHHNLREKQLVFTAPEKNDSMGTFLRMMKFYRLGYSIDNDSLGEVVAELCKSSGGIILNDGITEDFIKRFAARGTSERY